MFARVFENILSSGSERNENVILELCKGVHCVDLGESFQTHIYLQNLVSIQPRTSPLKLWPPQVAEATSAAGAELGQFEEAAWHREELGVVCSREEIDVGLNADVACDAMENGRIEFPIDVI